MGSLGYRVYSSIFRHLIFRGTQIGLKIEKVSGFQFGDQGLRLNLGFAIILGVGFGFEIQLFNEGLGLGLGVK